VGGNEPGGVSAYKKAPYLNFMSPREGSTIGSKEMTGDAPFWPSAVEMSAPLARDTKARKFKNKKGKCLVVTTALLI
jgi:hypothetical protein